MNSQWGVPLIILLWAGSLTLGQTMVMRTALPRMLAYAVVLTLVTALVVVLAYALFGKQRSTFELQAETKLLVVLGGLVNVAALWAGGRWAVARGEAMPDSSRLMTRLIGSHTGVVLGGGTLAAVVFVVFRLARVRW